MLSLDFGALAIAVTASAFALLVSLLPVTRTDRGLAMLGLLAAVMIERETLPGILAGFVVLYVALSILPSGNRRWTAACALMIGFCTIFSVWRLLDGAVPRVSIGPWRIPLWFMGMWHLLRMVNLTWEVGSGALAVPSFARFLAWGFLPLTLNGPLLRFAAMPAAPTPRPELWRSMHWWGEVLQDLAKIMGAMALSYVAGMIARRLGTSIWYKAYIALISGPWGFYLSTAGLFGLMERLGAVSGIAIPASFRNPFFTTNIAEFWARWNMTATALFRDYVFFNRWGLSGYNMYANTIILFVLVGLWHAANWYWILFGVLHGLYFCTYLAARAIRNRVPDTTLVRVVSGGATYVLVCAAWYLPSKFLQLVSR